MTNYTDHADSIFDVAAPILASTHLEARDNLKSVAEGGPNAPRINPAAFERVAAGDDVRSSAAEAAANDYIYDFAFLQVGVVRVKGTASISATYSVKVYRNGSVVSNETGSSVTSFSDDITVQPFDTVRVEWSNVNSTSYTVEICTDGGNLWCGNPSISTGVTGNTY